jgi:hypothetical protein
MPDPSPSPGRPAAASRDRPASAETADQKTRPGASGRQRRAGSARSAKSDGAAERNEPRWRDIQFVEFTIDNEAEQPIDPPPPREANPPPTAPAAETDGLGKVLRQFGEPVRGGDRTAIPGLAARFARMPVPRPRPSGAESVGLAPHPAIRLKAAPETGPGEGGERFPASVLTSVGIRPESPPPRPSLGRTFGAQLSQAGTALRRQREVLSAGVGARLTRARIAFRPRRPLPSASPGPEAKPSPAAILARRVHAAALRLAGNDPERLRRWLSLAGSAIAVAIVAYAIGAMVAGLAGSDSRRHSMSDQPAPKIELVTAQPKPLPPAPPPAPPPASATPPSEPVARAAYYLARAKTGDPVAQYDVGVLYAQGNGLVQDYASAASWFHAAAAQGNLDAEYNLGVFYERGLGVTANPIDAVNWYRSAADQNHARAQYNLAIAFAEGRGTEQDFAAAARWYRRAAQQGVVPAMVNLAILYERGQGVDRSPVDAYAWYSAAAERGDNPAKDRAGELLRQFSDQDKTKAQGLAASVAAAINGAPPA